MTTRDLLHAPAARSLLAGGGALAVLAAVTLAPGDVRPAEVPVLALEAREPAPAVHAVVYEVALEDEVEAPEAPDPMDPRDSIRAMASIEDPADFTFVVEIGGTTYIRIGDFAGDADRDDAVLVGDDLVHAAIAPISASALPEELRPWSGRRVLVDGTCAATVIGFAEIGRVSGDAGLASSDEDRATARWTVETAFSSGSTMIAAELDGDCTGSWARAADRPAAGRAIAVTDAGLEGAARGTFLASHAAGIAAGWREAAQCGNWIEPALAGDWRDHVTGEARIVQHSITGARWAYGPARKPGGCGDHEVNVAALYQVAADGALTEVETDDFPGRELAALVDLNRDGWFERLVVHTDPADHSLVGPADSTELASIGVPFHGCGC